MISPDEIKSFKYFSASPLKVLRILADASSLRSFKAGERLFEEGEQARNLMIVKSGEVEIVYNLGDSRQVVAEYAIKGDVVCWSAVLAPFKLTASAIGSKDGELVVIDAKTLLNSCDENSELGYRLMTEIAKGLRERLTGLRVQIAASK